MKKNNLPKKIPSDQLALFPYADTYKTIKKIGLALSQIEMLFNEGLISFNPADLKNLTEEQYIELIFVSSLALSSQSLFTLKTMLDQLEKPYLYSHDQIYFNFAASAWEALPEKSEDTIAPLQQKVQSAAEKNQIYKESAKLLSTLVLTGLIDNTIKSLKSIDAYNPLKYSSAWDELLTEVVEGKSLFWQIYLDILKKSALKHLNTFNDEILFSLALGESIESKEKECLKKDCQKQPDPDLLKKILEGSNLSRKELLEKLSDSVSEKILIKAETEKRIFTSENIQFKGLIEHEDKISSSLIYLSKIINRKNIKPKVTKLLLKCKTSLEMLPQFSDTSQFYICSYLETKENSTSCMKFFSLLLTQYCFELAAGISDENNNTRTLYRFIARDDGYVQDSGDFDCWYKWMVNFADDPLWKFTVSDKVEFN
jgi:hypothetical protein